MNEFWWKESLNYSARTDVGMRRSNNQDSFCTAPASSLRIWGGKGHLFIVADGMGAHAAGEKASRMAVETIEQSYLKREGETPSEALRHAVLDAHDAIKRKGESDSAFKEMGTTCDALALLPERAYIGHVGDSRVYRLRERAFEQMTFDHSLVWEVKYLHSERASYKQMERVPKNVITRSLGPTENLEVDIEGPIKTRPGDVFLLCSDGLSGQVDDSEMGQIVELFQPEDATETLINLAKLRGGPDNITVIVARIMAEPKPEDVEREVKRQARSYEKREPLNSQATTLLIISCALWGLAVLLWANLGEKSSTTFFAIIASLAAVACSCLFLFLGRKTLFRPRARLDLEIEKQGKAPYARASSAPTRAFSDKVAAMCDELCVEMKKKADVHVDWGDIDKARAKASAAVKSGDFGYAIRANFSVINHIMRELMKYSDKKKTVYKK